MLNEACIAHLHRGQDGVTMTFVLVPPGKFRMGSPFDQQGRYQNETLHMVTLTEPFDLGKETVGLERPSGRGILLHPQLALRSASMRSHLPILERPAIPFCLATR